MPNLKSLGYPCDQCDYKATQKAHLLRHLKSKHEGIKYPYDQCDSVTAHKPKSQFSGLDPCIF